MSKKVYIGMSADVFHHGHVNIISEARKYGDVYIGLLNDKAVADYKRLPYLSWDKRKIILENIIGVKEVFEQSEWDYSPTIKKLKPDIMVHGKDWLEGPLAPYRERAIKALNSYGGKLIEIEYTKDVSSTEITLKEKIIGTTPDIRKATLKRLLNAKKITRIMEAHNPLSALILENLTVTQNNKQLQFDGFWSSSLTDSTLFGRPDTESLDISMRLNNIDKIFDVTSKPLIMDIDTGGKLEHLKMKINSIEKLGISAVIMEDKTGMKRNSLFDDTSNQKQEDPKRFANKIKFIKTNQITNDFMVIARIESFILNKSIHDAINRAKKYVKANVDGIMIHSKEKNPKKVFEFAKRFRKFNPTIPLVCVPSTYDHVSEKILKQKGFDIVIYANQLLRSSYSAMNKVAKSILKNSKAKNAKKDMTSIKEIINLIP